MVDREHSSRRDSKLRTQAAKQARRLSRHAGRQARRQLKRAARAERRQERARDRRTLWEDAGNLPNLLTFLRVLMIPAVLVFLDRGGPRDCLVAAVIYGLAAVTDLLDGWLARRQGLVSVLGKFLDPLADKLMVASILVWLVPMGRIQAWVVVLLLARELTITALRAIASSEGLIISAEAGGKLKTAFQMIGILCLIIGYPYPCDYGIVDFGVVDYVHIGRLLVYLSLIFSITSAANYMQLFARAIEAKNQQPTRAPAR